MSNKSELFLELFGEEIPAVMQKDAQNGFKNIFEKMLKNLEVSFASIEAFIGPRRIVVVAKGLPTQVDAQKIEVKGPKVGASEQALDGFCRSQSVSKDQLQIQEVGGVECYFNIKEQPARDVRDILAENLADAIISYVWPKSMYWGAYELKWVRPMHNVLCLFDGQIVDFKLGHLQANNISYGHRFMAPDSFEVKSFADYQKQLQTKFVILDRDERLQIIKAGLQQKCQELGVKLKDDIGLLEEVAGLAEYPIVLAGSIDEKFLQVPSEALVTSMKKHQKYFSVLNESGDFAPYFLFITNIASPEPGRIIAGNEKVLSARLSDALYFYNQDLNKSLESRATKLEKVIFHEKLGSLADKTTRLATICQQIWAGDDDLQQAAKLSKSDIVSEMVVELPSLQGLMGSYYAIAEGRSEQLAVQIKNQYKPAGANDDVPQQGAYHLALLDKLDSLCGLMMAGEKPTGSKDPYALRRMALGIIRILVEHQVNLDLPATIAKVCQVFQKTMNDVQIDSNEIIAFIEERLKNYFKDQYSHQIINAGVDLSREGDIVEVVAKLAALKDFISSDVGVDVIASYKRSANILKSEKAGDKIDASIFKHDSEQRLYDISTKIDGSFQLAIEQKDYAGALQNLSELKQPLAEFFDNVMVKDDDKKVAANRLALLEKIRRPFDQIANFEEL